MNVIIYIILSIVVFSGSLIATSPDQETYRLGISRKVQKLPFTIEGFSGPETSHRWTDGNSATITIPIAHADTRRLKSVTLKNLHAFITESHAQQVLVSLNGSQIHDFKYNSQNTSQSFTLDIPLDVSGDAVIKVALPNACSPKELLLGEDSRKLGLAFNEVDIIYWDNIFAYRLGTSRVVQKFPFTIEGFSGSEITHRWTDGNQAQITIPVNHNDNRRLTAVTFNKTAALITPTWGQELLIALNDQHVEKLTYLSINDRHTFKVTIPSKLDGNAAIKFVMPNATSPSELYSGNGDTRKLGISFDGINLEYETLKPILVPTIPCSVPQTLLQGYDSPAKNAAVFVYGTSKKDSHIYALFCFDKRGFWTIPGGKRETSHNTILDTAVEELYEETAAFPEFNPSIIKPLLEKQSDQSVFKSFSKTQNIQTDLFALNIDPIGNLSVDSLVNIAVGSQQRVQGLSHSFNEMSDWKILPLAIVQEEFDINAKSKKATAVVINTQTYYMYDVKGLGSVPSFSYNSLKAFFQSGNLERVLKK